MVRKGVITKTFKESNSGVIVSNKTEFYFHANEVDTMFLPAVGTEVTFVKDSDYRTTNVACLIKRYEQKVA